MDEQSTFYRIPGRLLAGLGAVWGGTPSAISPFMSDAVVVVSQEDVAALHGIGLCDARGGVLPVALPALAVLGCATSFVRIYLSGSGTVKEIVVYRDESGASASLTNTGGAFDLEFPAQTQLMLAIVAQMTGSSAFSSMDFEVSLSGHDAIVLAAAIDLQRRATFRALADDMTDGAVDLHEQAVAAVCAQRTGGTQGLCNYFLDLASATGIPAAAVESGMKSLMGRGLLAPFEQANRLTDKPLELARRLLLIQQALTLTAGKCSSDGSVAVLGFGCLQAGVNDLLYTEVVGDALEMRMESAAVILELVRAFLDDPALLDGLSAAIQDVPAAGANCEECQHPLAVDVKFCPHCGTPRSMSAPAPSVSTPATCPHCGTEVETGARFCSGCGMKIEGQIWGVISSRTCR